MTKYIILINIVLFSISWSAAFIERSEPVKICGTPDIIQADLISRMEEMKTQNPHEYEQWVEANEEVRRFNSRQTQQRMFWAYNFNSGQYYTVTATLRKTGMMTNIWVDDQSWNNNYVNNSVLDELLNNLENISGPTSLDPSKGIIEIDTMLFGQPPNVDGDGIVDFLILDIQDSFDPNSRNSSFIAGYFSPSDQRNLPNSNQMDLMYLDAYPGIFFDGIHRTNLVLSTTAHEFQHLIHYNYDQSEELWVNEGLSQLAGTYCGYGLDFPGLYMEDPTQSLLQWSGEVRDYSKVNLWTLYCAEQLGLDFIKNLTQNPNRGIAGFNNAMAQTGIPGDLSMVYPSWALANIINDISVDTRHGYFLTEAQGLRASLTQLVSVYPKSISGSVKNYGVEYHRFRGQDSLTVSFLSGLPQNYWLVYDGNGYLVSTLTELNTEEPDFRDDNEYYLILYSTSSDRSYRYNAFARYSLNYYELAYDDNSVDLKISFQPADIPLIAANRFEVPENNLTLESVRFWNGSKDHTVNIQVYGQGGNGLPGNQLITPLDLTLNNENSWVNVSLPQPVENLNRGSNIFVGVQLNQAGVSLGYDDQNLPGNSYVRPNNSVWRPLSNFTINQQPANGLWMIRAVFTGLTFSDTTITLPTDSRLILANSYPNPFLLLAHQLTIRYENGPNPGNIQLKVFNSWGQKVSELMENADGSISWSGMGKYGPLAAGVYFYQLIFYDSVTGERIESDFQKVIILN